MKNFIGVLLSLVIVCFCCMSHDASADKISSITVSGNQRVEVETVKNYLGLNVGDDFNSESKIKAVKNLYATSMFENIEVNFSSGRLVVTVKETPVVSSVVFKGNSKVKSEIFSREIATDVGDSLSNAKLQSDADKIAEIYKRSGRFSVKVSSQVEKLQNNRVKVIFNIMEGPKTAIKNIYFVGNENYTASELRSIIMTKETAWYKFLDSNDTYDPDRMEYDKELLTRFYQSVGFADFTVISATAELSPTKKHFVATYSIEEGAKYNLGDIKIQNNIADVDTEVIKKLVTLKSGALFNMSALEALGQKMSDELGNMGYPQMVVVPNLQKDPVKKLVNVTFIVNKSPKIFINKINITGNVKTSEKVIRRQFRIAEGDIFNRAEIAKADRNIKNLDYFEKNDIKMVKSPNDPDRYDVNIDVQEKSTASIGFDVGYSSAEGGFGSINFTERNLFGTGKHLNTMVRRSQRRLSFNFGVTDPHFMDRDLSLGADFFTFSSGSKGSSGFDGEAQPYSQRTVGVKTILGYDISEDLSHEIAYVIKQDKLSVNGASSSIMVREQRGKFVTSALGHTVTYNRLDSNIVPKNGYILSASQQYAGLGGDMAYLKHEVDGKIFKSFSDNKITVKVYGEAGVINGINGKTVRISDRFSLGDYNLRGFAGGGAGPRTKGPAAEGLNGQKYYSGGIEMTFPVGLPEEMNVRGAIFSDIGGLWDFEVPKGSSYSKNDVWNDKSPRISVGAGILWTTRIMPIRIDWAIPVRYKKYDQQQRFHIRMSTSF